MLEEGERVYQRRADARLRRIPYNGGGAAFLPKEMITIELDEEAFALLCWLARPMTARQLRRRFVERFARNVTLARVDRTIRQLEECGFVVQIRRGTTVNDALRSEPETIPIAPESVHLQLNNVCNLRCPSCYVALAAEEDGSLSLEQLMGLIDDLAEMGVFQLALGGGEPLMSPNFLPLLRYARRKGLLPNVTTNGWLLTESLIAQIRDVVGEVRLSFNDGISVHHDLLMEKAILLRREGVPFGFNLIVTRHNIRRIGEILRQLVALRPRSVTLIRPKPAPHNERWYAANALSPRDSLMLIQQLRRLEALFAKTQLTVDCALSYLFYDLPEAELVARGVAGCSMGKRFVTIAWNGGVYPCSHLQDEEFKAGNITDRTFRAIWETSPLFASLRAGLDRLKGSCGRCIKRKFCGGCRAIPWRTTGDLQGADIGCPFSEGGRRSIIPCLSC